MGIEQGAPDMITPEHLALNLSEWGQHWLRAATDFPDFAAACHWYAAMNAMHIMALEANA